MLKIVKHLNSFSQRRTQTHLRRSLVRHFTSCHSNDSKYLEFVDELSTYKSGEVILKQNNTDGISEVILDNPTSMNAISGSMAVQLNDIIDQLKLWDNGKVVLFRGSNDQFCTGGDLKNFMSKIETSDKGAMMCRYMQELMLKFQQLPFINVAVLQGKTFGGGAEFAVACDIRLMEENAVLGFVQARMGLTTGFGGGRNLVKLLGYQNAMRMLISNRILNAQQALQVGLVDAVIPNEEGTYEGCKRWLDNEHLIDIDASLIQSIKSMTLAASRSPCEESLVFERETFRKFWKGRLHEEAMSNNVKHR